MNINLEIFRFCVAVIIFLIISRFLFIKTPLIDLAARFPRVHSDIIESSFYLAKINLLPILFNRYFVLMIGQSNLHISYIFPINFLVRCYSSLPWEKLFVIEFNNDKIISYIEIGIISENTKFVVHGIPARLIHLKLTQNQLNN